MATLTRAEVVALALEAVGAKPAGVAASAVDTDIGQKAFDSAYNRLRKYGYVPFATSATPDWAWSSFTAVVAAEAAGLLGITGNRLAEWEAKARKGEYELARQVAGYKHQIAVKADYF